MKKLSLSPTMFCCVVPSIPTPLYIHGRSLPLSSACRGVPSFRPGWRRDHQTQRPGGGPTTHRQCTHSKSTISAVEGPLLFSNLPIGCWESLLPMCLSAVAPVDHVRLKRRRTRPIFSQVSSTSTGGRDPPAVTSSLTSSLPRLHHHHHHHHQLLRGLLCLTLEPSPHPSNSPWRSLLSR